MRVGSSGRALIVPGSPPSVQENSRASARTGASWLWIVGAIAAGDWPRTKRGRNEDGTTHSWHRGSPDRGGRPASGRGGDRTGADLRDSGGTHGGRPHGGGPDGGGGTHGGGPDGARDRRGL